MTADEISMRVCFDDVLDRLSVCIGLIQVLLNVALRIDHRGLAFGPDVIRRVGETPKIKLLEIHIAPRFGILAIRSPIPHSLRLPRSTVNFMSRMELKYNVDQ